LLLLLLLSTESCKEMTQSSGWEFVVQQEATAAAARDHTGKKM